MRASCSSTGFRTQHVEGKPRKNQSETQGNTYPVYSNAYSLRMERVSIKYKKLNTFDCLGSDISGWSK